MPDAGRRAVSLVVILGVVALGVSAVAGASGPVASESGQRVLLIANCFKPTFKPAKVIIACGDGSLGARGMTWSRWTRKTATGTGTGFVNDCDPDCVYGKTETAPIELLLSRPQLCSNGKRVFAKLRYVWTSGAPVGSANDAVPIGCKLAAL
jgi:hypothetical protein